MSERMHGAWPRCSVSAVLPLIVRSSSVRMRMSEGDEPPAFYNTHPLGDAGAVTPNHVGEDSPEVSAA